MSDEDVLEWRGCEVIDRDGEKVGTLEEIYLDEQTRRPEWAIVKRGFMGRTTTFVPLIGAMREGEHVRVRYEKEQLKDAPAVDPEGGLTQEEEEQVYGHYGLDYSRAESQSGLPEGEAEALPGPRLRLRKYVVTDYVPVQREEVRVESEPARDEREEPSR
jgi:sporulation protein YlmC with PRC-barrel domain